MATLKQVAAQQQIVTDLSLEQTLIDLKLYITTQMTTESTARSNAVNSLQQQLDTLVGGDGDLDKIINTFNEVKAFLADYSEDDTLKSLIDAVDTAVSAEAARAQAAETSLGQRITDEQTRATTAEGALSGRITTLENVEVMSAQDAATLFDSVFNPQTNEQEP
ncbi:MAG: hypothetical protein II886_13165 [Prevotella sp.]|nr:hypothetical protein [Prevotella sp.]